MHDNDDVILVWYLQGLTFLSPSLVCKQNPLHE